MTETEKLQHFGWLLIDLIYDLSVPAVIFRDYLQHDSVPKDGHMFQGVSRMCKFSVIIALCKLHDALRDHGQAVSTFPTELRAEVKNFRRFVAEKTYSPFAASLSRITSTTFPAIHTKTVTVYYLIS